MTFEILTLITIAVYLGGTVLLALSFVNIAVSVYRFSVARAECACFPGTRLPLYPTLIVFAGAGFIFSGFAFTHFLLIGHERSVVFFATAVTLLGLLVALYGIYQFYKREKVRWLAT